MRRLSLLILMALFTAKMAMAMGYNVARGHALYLTDKIHYELDLTDAQADAVYEINLDYFLCIEGSNDIYGFYWSRRNSDLQYVLTMAQYKQFITTEYFFKPLLYEAGSFLLSIYKAKAYRNVGLYFYDKPSVYATYKGGKNKNANSRYKGKDFITGSKKTEPKRSDGKKQVKTRAKYSSDKKSQGGGQPSQGSSQQGQGGKKQSQGGTQPSQGGKQQGQGGQSQGGTRGRK